MLERRSELLKQCVLFEDGETAHGANRIVRVGTHTGNNNLRSRLKQHFVKENKDRSILQKNIGRALLNRDHDPFLSQWDLDLTSSKAKHRFEPILDRAKQIAVEKMVTDTIRTHFHFVAFREDEKDRRVELESKIISTISKCSDCGPSNLWLGLHSPKRKIGESGLWLVRQLDNIPLTEGDFLELEEAIL